MSMTSPLPYVRLSRRQQARISALNALNGDHPNHGQFDEHNDLMKVNEDDPGITEVEMLETMAIREVRPDLLLATKRIITAFNSGDIESIHDIVFESALDICEVYFSNLRHVFVGKSALFSLWSSLFEAFPNGIFRTSDSVINQKKQVYTSFLFVGTKIFPLLIDGMPLEVLASSKKQPSLPDAQYLMQTASVIVDTNRPMFTTAELLEAETIPEMVFEGRIVLHLNEKCRIRKFDFAWNRKL